MGKGIARFLIDDPACDSVVPLLHPSGGTIRIYRHWTTASTTWWKASVPLSMDGKNRTVLVQSLQYDLELSCDDFIAWIDEFRQGGITLVQSDAPLPYDLHPARFKHPGGFENVLKLLDARMVFELPHQHETAEVTVFSKTHAEWLAAQDKRLRPAR